MKYPSWIRVSRYYYITTSHHEAQNQYLLTSPEPSQLVPHQWFAGGHEIQINYV